MAVLAHRQAGERRELAVTVNRGPAVMTSCGLAFCLPNEKAAGDLGSFN